MMGGAGAMRTAVCAHWNEIGIDDIYSGSASGERTFSRMHVLRRRRDPWCNRARTSRSLVPGGLGARRGIKKLRCIAHAAERSWTSRMSCTSETEYVGQNVDPKATLYVRESATQPAVTERAHRYEAGGFFYFTPGGGSSLWCMDPTPIRRRLAG